MSDSMKAISEDYEDYINFCNKHNEEYFGTRLNTGKSFYDHWEQLKEKYSKAPPFKETNTINEVAEFHRVFQHPILDSPNIPAPDRVRLRLNLLSEELQELREAIMKNDLVGIADAFADLQFVLTGAVLEFGMHKIFPALCTEVYRSNMSKACDTMQEAQDTCDTCNEACRIEERDGKFFVYRVHDNKTIKNVNYSPANLEKIVYDTK